MNTANHTTKQGRLIAASLGPGDPGLITRRAWDALKSAPCWAWPISRKEGGGYARAIVERAGLTPPSCTLPLDFPMTRDAVILARNWSIAAQKVLATLNKGLDVVFLIEGDASFFATFGHLQRTILAMDPQVMVEIIPGVSSPLAGAALHQKGLCEGDQTLAIVPATVGMARIDTLLTDFETVVLLKIRPVLDKVLSLLETRQLSHKAVFVERAGSPDERLITDVNLLRGEDVNYLSLMIIHCNDGEANLGNRE
ncbi:MAG: precorrin-2 C(20)-methyltransferase [Magnetococcales bacterium]|nr:precorrin-2 C(20)-methyltransferase [Magnetococcales bacterium]